MNRWSYIVVVLAIAAIGAGLYLWLSPEPEPEAPPKVAVAPPAPEPAPPPPPAEPPPEPAVQYPLDTPANPPSPPDVAVGLVTLLGPDAVKAFFNLDNFFIRVVATVDNLGRGHASPAMWPVNPTPGRFTAMVQPPNEVIAPGNYARYKRFIDLMTKTDTDRAATLYKQWYPQLQKAYEELGYPKRYFNDRVIAVIDTLLATPEPDEPLTVNLPDVKGPKELKYPWTHYEYTDASLEDLSSGQKILLRMGPANRKAAKDKLAAFRKEIASLANKSP